MAQKAKKRHAGEGTYETLPSGKYRYKRQITLLSGKKMILRSSAFATKKDAKANWDKKYRKVAHLSELKTVSEAYAEYLPIKSAIVKPATAHTIKADFDVWILPKFGNTELSAITRADIQAWVTCDLMTAEKKRSGAKLQESSIRAIVGKFKSFLTWCVMNDLIETNPCKGIEIPRREKTLAERRNEKMRADEDFLNVDELSALIAELKTEKYDKSVRNAILFAAYTGVRVGEVLGLTWDAVKEAPEDDYVGIWQTLAEPREGEPACLQTPKTEASNRQLKLTPALRELFAEQRALQVSEKRHWKWDLQMPSWNEMNLVFCRADGTYLTRSIFDTCLKQAGKAIGLKYSDGSPKIIHPHTLRHTFVTVMVSEGILTLDEAGRYLGHSSTATTQTFYHRGRDLAMKLTGEKAGDFFAQLEGVDNSDKAEKQG